MQAALPVRAASSAASNPVTRTILSSNVTYVSYIFVGAVVLEAVYGTVTEGIWNSINKGVRGWGKWKAAA